MSNIVNLNDKRSLYDKISTEVDSHSFMLLYFTEEGGLAVLQGDETTVTDMAMFKALTDYISALSIENMYIRQGELDD